MSIHTVPGPTGTNDTNNFRTTLTAAAADIGSATGPNGAQGYVHVNAGTYRISGISLPANVRLEVDAAAIIQQVSGASDDYLFTVDAGGANAPVQNVTLIGSGNSMANKEVGKFGRQNNSQFVANMDAATSGGNVHAKLIDLGNCSWVRVQNIYCVGNWADHTGAGFDNTAAHITCHSNSSSVLGGPYYHPRHCYFCNLYAINEPIGYGLTQLTSGEYLNFYYVYERGGIPIRMETDFGSQEGQGIPARLGRPDGAPGVVAEDIICDSGRCVASYSPHYQVNYNCSAKGLYAWSCQDAVRVSSFISGNFGTTAGAFVTSSYDSVTAVAGPTAQRDGVPWTIGNSKDPASLAATTYTLAGTNVLALEGANSTDGRTTFSVSNSTGTTPGATGYQSTRTVCADLQRHPQPRTQGSSLWLL